MVNTQKKEFDEYLIYCPYMDRVKLRSNMTDYDGFIFFTNAHEIKRCTYG